MQGKECKTSRDETEVATKLLMLHIVSTFKLKSRTGTLFHALVVD